MLAFALALLFAASFALAAPAVGSQCNSNSTNITYFNVSEGANSSQTCLFCQDNTYQPCPSPAEGAPAIPLAQPEMPQPSLNARPSLISAPSASSGPISGAAVQTANAPAQPSSVPSSSMLEILAALFAVVAVAYLLIMQTRGSFHNLSGDALADELMRNQTRAGIMGELKDADRIPTDLSLRLGKSKSSIVEHLDALVEAGLVERMQQPGKKFVYYRLTQKGRQILLKRAG
jgi:DNA-binding transcriptional ArsR family regulator